MIQEDKELLLKDLCARLPYGVKIVIQDTFKYSIVSREYHVLDVSNFSDIFCFNYEKFDKRMKKAMRERPNDIVIKPYLFPLSSMTLEQRCKLQDLLSNNCDISFNNQKITFYDEGNIRLEQLEKIFHFFNLFHFDYRGLIEKGLAIDATGLNIY